MIVLLFPSSSNVIDPFPLSTLKFRPPPFDLLCRNLLPSYHALESYGSLIIIFGLPYKCLAPRDDPSTMHSFCRGWKQLHAPLSAQSAADSQWSPPDTPVFGQILFGQRISRAPFFTRLPSCISYPAPPPLSPTLFCVVPIFIGLSKFFLVFPLQQWRFSNALSGGGGGVALALADVEG